MVGLLCTERAVQLYPLRRMGLGQHKFCGRADMRVIGSVDMCCGYGVGEIWDAFENDAACGVAFSGFWPGASCEYAFTFVVPDGRMGVWVFVCRGGASACRENEQNCRSGASACGENEQNDESHLGARDI